MINYFAPFRSACESHSRPRRSTTPEKLSSSKRRKLRRDAVHRYQVGQNIKKMLCPKAEEDVTIPRTELLKRRIYASGIQLKCVDELRPQPQSSLGTVLDVNHMCHSGEQRLVMPPPIASSTRRHHFDFTDASRIQANLNIIEAWRRYECKAMENEDLRGTFQKHCMSQGPKECDPLSNEAFEFRRDAKIFVPGASLPGTVTSAGILHENCTKCDYARMVASLDEDTAEYAQECICNKLLCQSCDRPLSYCLCSSPSVVSEQCLRCGLFRSDTLDCVWCVVCKNSLATCECESSLFSLIEGMCEDDFPHHFALSVNYRDDFEDPIVCKACQGYLTYEEQVRCDADECVNEFSARDGEACHPCFFHEECLIPTCGGLLCQQCTDAGKVIESDSSEETLDEEEAIGEDGESVLSNEVFSHEFSS